MTDYSKITFGPGAIASMIVAGVFCCTVTLAIADKLNDIEKKIDVLQATNKGIQDVTDVKVSAIRDQVELNTLAIKTIADFLKPEDVKRKNYR